MEKVYAEFFKPEAVLLSPEGVEEIVKGGLQAVVTLTQGGKYRVYLQPIDGSNIPAPTLMKPTLEEALKSAGEGTIVFGGMLANPKRTLEILIDKMKGYAPD